MHRNKAAVVASFILVDDVKTSNQKFVRFKMYFQTVLIQTNHLTQLG